MCVIADDKLQRVKIMFLLTLLLQMICLQFYIKQMFFLSGQCNSLLYFYSTIVIIDLQNFCKFTVLLATKIASKSL